jgi:hypothetical protein
MVEGMFLPLRARVFRAGHHHSCFSLSTSFSGIHKRCHRARSAMRKKSCGLWEIALQDAADSVLKGHSLNCVLSKLLSILVPIRNAIALSAVRFCPASQLTLIKSHEDDSLSPVFLPAKGSG